MTTPLATDQMSLPREHVEAAQRVLEIAASILGQMARHSNPLYATGGDSAGLWTVREIRDHAKAASKMLAKDLKPRKRR